jgi:hypothetical protein
MEYREFFSSVGGEYMLKDRLIVAADAGFSSTITLIEKQFIFSLVGFSYLIIDNISIDTGLKFCYQQKLVDLFTFGTTVKL